MAGGEWSGTSWVRCKAPDRRLLSWVPPPCRLSNHTSRQASMFADDMQPVKHQCCAIC